MSVNNDGDEVYFYNNFIIAVSVNKLIDKMPVFKGDGFF